MNIKYFIVSNISKKKLDTFFEPFTECKIVCEALLKMKINRIISVTTTCVLLFIIDLPAHALSYKQYIAIQSLIDEGSRISGASGISVSICLENNLFFFSSGYSNRELSLPADEYTLYELASVSKSFTAFGMLLLEEQGLLSMNHSIVEYLPWCTLQYKGQPVDMQNITLNHFLHHSTGLVNKKHVNFFPQGNTPDLLKKTVEMVQHIELDFLPGAQYQYGTVNYDVLGLVIENVSGQSFGDFMEEHIFSPLGLTQTYVHRNKAIETGRFATGYRRSFFMTTPYKSPEYGGNVPAGYIISSSKDMARWMGIQMKLVDDIPAIFHTIIPRTHKGDKSVASVNGMYYAAGWGVNAEQTLIAHAGQNPNFKTNVALFPEEQIAITVLSNCSSTNVINLLNNIKNILNENIHQTYQKDFMQIIDTIATFITLIAGVCAILFGYLITRRKKLKKKFLLTKKRVIIIAVWTLFTIIMMFLCWVIFPLKIGMNWSTILIWLPRSIPTAILFLSVLCLNITLYLYRTVSLDNKLFPSLPKQAPTVCVCFGKMIKMCRSALPRKTN